MLDITQFKAKFKFANMNNGASISFSSKDLDIEIQYDSKRQPSSIEFLTSDDVLSFFKDAKPESMQSYKNIPEDKKKLLESLLRGFKNREIEIERTGTVELVDLDMDQDANGILYLIESAAKEADIFLGEEENRPFK